MRRRFSIPLMRQAAFSLLLGAAAALGSFCEFFISFHYPPLTTRLLLWTVLAIGSYIAAIWISYDVRTGVESGRWSEAETERFRTFYSASWFKGLSLTLAFATVLFLSFSLSAHHPLRALGFDFLLLSQTSQQILTAARRPESPAPGQRIDWRNAPPITSEHWGQRRS